MHLIAKCTGCNSLFMPGAAGGMPPVIKRLLMRISLLSMTILCSLVLFARPGNAQRMDKVKVDVQFKGIGLKQALRKLEAETPFHFTYRDADLDNTNPVSFEAKQATVAQVLKVIFGNQSLVFYQQNTNIIIKKQTEFNGEPVTTPVGLPPLSEVIRGKVTNEKSEPLEGVTISEKGTSNSTSTNAQGLFTMIVASGTAVLKLSYIGHQPQDVNVNGQTVLSVSMQSLANDLTDVVVVAYGQRQKKIETLGAQSTLNVTELKQPVANITTVLAGRVSGLVGVQRTGEPGQDNADLWIRGIATMSNSTPLVLVDGVERSFNNIDPNDIESFTILKDASSTSVFGVKGANGVILITTKKGRAGKTDISLDFYSGLTSFTRLPKTADGVKYLQMANEASMTRGGNPVYSEDIIHKTYTQEDPYLYPNVNWFKEIFKDFGKNRKGNLSIRGGNEKSNFYVSAGYYDETGLFQTDGLQKYNTSIKFTRYNFSSALSIKATRSTTVDLGIKGWISNGNYPGTTADGSTATDDIFYMALKTYPTLYPKMYPDNKEPFLSTGGGLNSAYALLTNHGYMTIFQNQIMSDLQIKQDLGFITKGLSGRLLYSFDAASNNSLKRTKNPGSYYATGRDANGDLVYTVTGQGQDYLAFSRTNGGNRQFYLEGAINYANTFGNHKVSGMVLYNQSDRVDATANDLIGAIPYRSLGSVGRFTYAYDGRYLAEATFGYNGAETFAPGKRFGFFPSYALGWVISNEKFYHLNNVFQLIKLRASYGLVGNSRINGRRFGYVGTVTSTTGYSYGQDRSNAINGVDINDYPVDATWETEKDLNLGLEFKTFNNALYIQTDVFKRRRENIFLNRGVMPDFLGIRNTLLGNLGIVESEGIDITAEYNRTIGKVSVSLRGTFTYNKNKRIEDDSPSQPYPWLESRGLPVFYRMGYQAGGFYTQDEINDPKTPRTTGVVQAGDLKFKDLNGDGVIDANDMAVMGRDQVPQILYGFGTSIGWKQFSLSAFFQGTGLVDFYLGNDFMPFRNGSSRGSLYDNILDRWTVDNPRQDAFYPRLSYGADINQNYANNSHWVMNGRFLRLKTLDFGYTLKKGALSKFGVQQMRIYTVGYNLLTFSPFKLWDPELGGGSGTGGAGTKYPNIKTFSVGVNVTF
jgi:TonB-linked SusC/RagA family outer membrane protein